jgi:hypothetical protein
MIYSLLFMILLKCPQPISQNIISLCLSICLSIEPISPFLEKTSRLSRTIIKEGSPIILKLEEKLLEPIPKVESRTEELSKLVVSVLPPFFRKDEQRRGHFKNHT